MSKIKSYNQFLCEQNASIQPNGTCTMVFFNEHEQAKSLSCVVVQPGEDNGLLLSTLDDWRCNVCCIDDVNANENIFYGKMDDETVDVMDIPGKSLKDFQNAWTKAFMDALRRRQDAKLISDTLIENEFWCWEGDSDADIADLIADAGKPLTVGDLKSNPKYIDFLFKRFIKFMEQSFVDRDSSSKYFLINRYGESLIKDGFSAEVFDSVASWNEYMGDE